MKLFTSAAVAFCLLLAVPFSLQIPQLVDCPNDFLDKNPSYASECQKLTCSRTVEGDYDTLGIPCDSEVCGPGTQMVREIEANHTLTYPDCCPSIICE